MPDEEQVLLVRGLGSGLWWPRFHFLQLPSIRTLITQWVTTEFLYHFG